VVYVGFGEEAPVSPHHGRAQPGHHLRAGGAKREEAKSLTEEEVTGAIIRALKTGDRNACFASTSGEMRIDDTNRNGLSALRETLEKNNYKVRAISLVGKPEVTKDCTVLIVAAPRLDYADPEVAAIQKFVEDGGRALFMLDPR